MKRGLFIILFCCATLVTAQKKQEATSLKMVFPESIYLASFNAGLDSLYPSTPLLKEFDASLKFMRFSYIDMNRGLMTVPLQRFRDISKEQFYETYQDLYQQSYFRKAYQRNSGNQFFDIHNYRARFKNN
jgi:hypothetical protein